MRGLFHLRLVQTRTPLSEGLIADHSTGAFWVVQGTMNMPFYAVGQNYSPTGNSLEGMHTAEYHATLGFYYMTLAAISFVYLICSIRTNVCFFVALLSIVSGFSLLAGVFFQIALGHMAEAAKLQKVCSFAKLLVNK